MKANLFGGIKTNRVTVIVSCLFIIACCMLPVAAIVDESLTVPQIQGKAFPEGEAGLAAYINTSQNIDLEKIKTIFSSVDEVGDNYIIGVVPISDWCKTINTHVYADTNGWMVAYLKKDEPASCVMQWGDANIINNPNIGVIKSTTLEDALYKAGNAAGVGLVSTDIKYYDFEFPNADKMMIVAKTQGMKGSSIFQLELPSTYTLYEASYYHYEYYYTWYYQGHRWTDSSFNVDGSTISDANTKYIDDKKYGSWAALDQLKGAITTGKLHTISISHTGNDAGSAGVAIVLIYKAA